MRKKKRMEMISSPVIHGMAVIIHQLLDGFLSLKIFSVRDIRKKTSDLQAFPVNLVSRSHRKVRVDGICAIPNEHTKMKHFTSFSRLYHECNLRVLCRT